MLLAIIQIAVVFLVTTAKLRVCIKDASVTLLVMNCLNHGMLVYCLCISHLTSSLLLFLFSNPNNKFTMQLVVGWEKTAQETLSRPPR